MMRAQGTWYSPAGNFLVYEPGITTERAGTRPLYSTGCSLVTSMILVDAVSTTLAPNTTSLSRCTPSTTIAREPMKQLSSIITGAACTGSNTPPMPTPPLRCTCLPICAHEPTVAQVSTIVPSPTWAPRFTNDGISTTF